MKCPTPRCNRETLTGDKCAYCLLKSSEFTNTLLDIVGLANYHEMRHAFLATVRHGEFNGAEPRRARQVVGQGRVAVVKEELLTAAQDTQEALPANRGRGNSATQTYERPDSAEMPTAPTHSEHLGRGISCCACGNNTDLCEFCRAKEEEKEACNDLR